ncbi:MAG: peptidase, partial [Oscillospiraceae bacterium]|nr:peptidase [Oscillospiraceae bacterium]
MEFIIIGAIVVILLIIIVKNIFVVQQSRAYVIERLGAFNKVQSVGLHFKVPFVDRIARKVSLKEQVLDYPPQPVITKDNVTMQIDTVVYFQITDPKLYAYGVEQPMAAMETLT